MSILNETKAALGLAEDHVAFDTELVLFINSVLSRLTQLGAGPTEGFRITGEEESWEEFMGPSPKLNMVKTYMYNSVKLYFDPPEIGFVITMIKDQILKDEYLINLEVEPEPVVPTRVVLDPFGESVLVVPGEPLPDGTILDGGTA